MRIYLFGEVARHSGFMNFVAARLVAKCHTVNSLQNAVSATCTWDSILSVITQDS